MLRIQAAGGIVALLATITFGQPREGDPPPDPKPAKDSETQHGPSSRVRVGFDSAAATPVSRPNDITAEGHAGSTPGRNSSAERKRGAFVGAPIPISSPFLGSGLGLVAAYVLRLNPRDEMSPPSIFGAAGLYTNTGTWFGVGAAKLYFMQDRYRTTLVAGQGEFNYDLYGIGQKAGQLGSYVPIRQTGSALFFQGLRRLPRNFFLGPRYQIRSLTLKVRPDGDSQPAAVNLPEIGVRQQTAALGLAFQNDSRNSQFYPTSGGRFNFSADFFRQGVGSNRNYERYQLEFHRNPRLSPRQVLAYRFYGCAIGGPAPVYDLCLYGLDNDIRGYSTGRYRDRRMFAVQTEYRLELPKRFGVVAFAGVGGVAPSIGKFRADSLLPGCGVGMRYKLDKKNHINFRFDYAVGKNGGAYYVGIAEAF